MVCAEWIQHPDFTRNTSLPVQCNVDSDCDCDHYHDFEDCVCHHGYCLAVVD
ncbi:hypothetical protein GOV07_01965 [Candidatus Woesearchaeota archaeon]|nr:hypothetical protein [Candidatus Woesearchaeota archaeon]